MNGIDFDAIDLADRVGSSLKIDLGTADSLDHIVGHLRGAIDRARTNPIVMHGRRVEAMFGHIVASLGASQLVKREDAGAVICDPADKLALPDYRVVTQKGENLLIEVKNWRPANPTKDFRLKQDYVEKLQRFATVVDGRLKFAVYWSQWNVWTMIDPACLVKDEDRLLLPFTTALKSNEMVTLGDRHFGTTPPLVLRIVTDPDKPRTLDHDGNVVFTIGEVKVLAGDKEILEDPQQKLVLYFMFYGGWAEEQPLAKFDGDTLLNIDFVSKPIDEESASQQGFDIIGAASSLMAREYNDLTTSDKTITRLAPTPGRTDLGTVLLGADTTQDLPLWIFHMSPGAQ